MYQTLTTDDAAQLLTQDKHAHWTYSGARALVAYLEELEESTGEPMEFDVVAIRCDYTQYASAVEAASDASAWTDGVSDWQCPEWGPDDLVSATREELSEKHARQYLRDQFPAVIDFDGGIVLSSF